MSTDPASEPIELDPPYTDRRIVVLCLPAWVATIWGFALAVTHHFIPSLAPTLTSRVATYTATAWTMLAPLFWFGAFISVFRSGKATKFQIALVAVTAFVMVATWIVLRHFMRP